MTVDPQERREPTIFNSLLILIFVGLFLFVALLYRQKDLSRLAILVLMVVGGAKAWSIVSPARIRCSSTIENRRVFPDESVSLETTAENGKWLPVWLRILWSVDGALKPEGDPGAIIRQEAFVLWHQIVKFSQSFVALRRGVYQVGPPRIRTSDPLGFYEKEKIQKEAVEIVVYPRLVSLKPVAIRRRDLFGVPGTASPVKDPIYILGTRDYQPSSPARHIHWKASARHRRLQEKVFEPSGQAKVLLTLDVASFEGSHQKECFEDTLEVLASLAVKLDRMGYAVGLAANGTLKGGHASVLPLTRSPRQVPALLEILARMQTMPQGTMAEAIKQSLGSKRGISCIHFCYRDDPSDSDMEKFFQKRQIPVSFLVYRRDPESRSSQGKSGIPKYTIHEIRLDRSRQT